MKEQSWETEFQNSSVASIDCPRNAGRVSRTDPAVIARQTSPHYSRQYSEIGAILSRRVGCRLENYLKQAIHWYSKCNELHWVDKNFFPLNVNIATTKQKLITSRPIIKICKQCSKMKFKYLSVALLRIRTVSMWKVWFGFIVGTCDRRCSIYVLTNGEPCLPPTACLPGGELRTWGWGRQPVDLEVLGAEVGEGEVERGHAGLGWSQSAWLTTRMQEGRVRGRGPADQEVLWHIMSNRNHGHGGAGVCL